MTGPSREVWDYITNRTDAYEPVITKWAKRIAWVLLVIMLVIGWCMS